MSYVTIKDLPEIQPVDLSGNEYMMVTDETSNVSSKFSVDSMVVYVGEHFDNTVDGKLELKVDKITGKGLSTEDYTSAEKFKLGTLQNYTHPDSVVISGTYTQVVVNAKGHVTSGTNPTTIDEYNITDAYTKTEIQTELNLKANIDSPTLVTPNIGVATGTSFNSITGLASVAPLIAGTAAVGTSTLTARQDHVHPVQTTISGNAGTATTLATPRLINGTSFNGSADITVPVNTTQKSDAVSYNIPFVSNITVGNQNLYTDSVSSLTYNPSTNTLATAAFAGALTGNASTATTLVTARNITLSGDVSGTASFNGGADALISTTIADNSHLHTIANVTGLQSALDAKVDDIEKGSANGVATLDVNGKVTLTQIPDSVLGQLEYMGTWDFTTLPTATQKGQYWIASASGNGYITGDWAVWNGTSFDKVDNTDAVATVAGRTGNVVLTKSDVGLANVDNTTDSSKPVSIAQQNALNLKQNVLVSGTNIKTVNSSSILGSGNLALLASINPSITGSITEQVYNLTGTAINPANGTIQYKTVSANTTFTETLTSGQSVLLRLIDASNYTITFPTITWVGVVAPTLTANCAIVLWKEQSTLYGSFVGTLV